ncbi:MAG: WD40 repeat domain-containing protein [Planctomyces sp.]|nr:WD40 repeat domain-containing protein [Planctomyces sp.]
MADDAAPPALDIKQAKVTSTWAHDRPLVTCRFDPLGRYVFCGAEDNTIQRFQLSDGAKTPLVGGHDTWVHALAFSKDGETLLSGGCEGRLVWWPAAAEQPQPARQVDAHHGWIRALAVSPDGTLVASAGNDAVIRLWNVADGSPVRELRGHARDIYSLLWHPSGEFLISGDLMGVIRQWDITADEPVKTFDAKDLHSFNGGQQVDFGGVRGLALSPDGRHLAAGGLHKASNPLGAVHEPLVLLFNWETQELVRSQTCEGITQGVIWRLCYLPDGTLVGASGGGNGGWLFFYNAESDKDIHRFQLPNILREMDVHPDGIQVATAHHDRNVRITRLAADAG